MSTTNHPDICAIASRSKLDWALYHARLGWAVLPLQFITDKGRCSCGKPAGECKPGKHPLTTSIFKRGFKDANRDIEIITRTWTEHPQANIGIALGEYSALDIDHRHCGQESLHTLESRHGALPATVTALTGSGDGSHHVIMRANGAEIANIAKVDGLPGIELKATGYLVAVGSRTQHPYAWQPGASPDDIAIAPMPDWLVNLSLRPFRETPAKQAYPPLTAGDNEKALAAALESCAFLRHCAADARVLPEPEWQAMIELLVFFGDLGIAKIHELSQPYPTYSEQETNAKIANALKCINMKGLGPYSCQKIQQSLGFACPPDCRVTTLSPVPWAMKAVTGGRPLHHTPIDENSQVQPKLQLKLQTKLQNNMHRVQPKLQERGHMDTQKTRGATRRAWVKVYITGWLNGSIRWQLTPEERGVWADLLCLAGLCGREGRICDNDGKPYPLKYVTNMLNIPESLLLRTISKCKAENRLTEEDGVISITNWKVYQSEYERQRGYRDKPGEGYDGRTGE